MYEYEVAQTRYLSPTVLELTLRTLGGANGLIFEAGQYLTISFKRRSRRTPARCFSITSSPTQQGILQLAMRVGGDFTQAAAELAPGQRVQVQGPFGEFTRYDDDEKSIFLAGGIGITPFMGMIREATARRSEAPITLLYSCQNQNDVPYAAELLALERQNPHLSVIFLIGKGATSNFRGAKVTTGRLSADLIRQITRGSSIGYGFYICGPKAYMKAAEKYLRKQGSFRDQITTEAFSQAKSGLLASILTPNINTMTYGMTAAALLVATGSIMTMDLVRTIPKISASTQSSVVPSATSSPVSNAGTSSGTQQPASDTSNSFNSTTVNNNAAATPTAQPVQTSTYQAPVSSVS